MVLTISDYIEITSIVINSITSIVAIAISISALTQSSKAIFESSRANISFFVDTPTGGQYFLVLKNFGNSSGKILNIDITPKLDFSKVFSTSEPLLTITDYKNIVLAPNQQIKSYFPFSKYPDKVFNISITYETMNKTYTEESIIDLTYTESINYLRKTPIDIRDEKQALLSISNAITTLTEKL